MAPSTFRRAGKNPTPRKAFSQKNSRPNASILSFFKKVEVENTLFCGEDVPSNEVPQETNEAYDPGDDPAFITERGFPDKSPKRRKLSRDDTRDSDIDNGQLVADSTKLELGTRSSPSTSLQTSGKAIGGFVVDDSESEDEDEECSSPVVPMTSAEKVEELGQSPKAPENDLEDCTMEIPSTLVPQGLIPELVDECGLEYLEGGSEDQVGEEYREMLFSQEQARLEAEEAGLLVEDDFAPRMPLDDSTIETCPVCNGSLLGATPDESTRHVNSCLDGNPTPLPSKKPAVPEAELKPERSDAVKAHPIAEKAAVPRAGQRNPFALAPESGNSSAFSKLMSGNAENAAWSEAAAAETASRGKPAYKRTCPFYKIMPGFLVCVDAFRYGAVKDCNAYFLSHFHSDHYIGLTSNWKHGPIYCSRVTGRLVKQQLRVDAKWVVELEFEQQFEIPGTGGAVVTMISANHCPGSSMFLFEKKMGRGPRPRLQRILHCGDFRACPAHVAHDRLKPDILDKAGKLRQQKIDICYLDTTYLSPRYSFPPQSDVITACAELCAELDSDAGMAEAAWDKVGKQTGNASVSQFFGNKVNANSKTPGPKTQKDRLLVVCGTYSIGKERICVAIAKALNSKIFASAAKTRIFRQLDDPELAALLTTDPLEAQVHMQSLMEIRAETLQDYLGGYRPHFTRVVGFRPSGWNYRPAGASKMISAGTQPGAVPTAQILHSKVWRTRFGKGDLQRQRGSTKEAMCFGVPYSEHSSFRELALFLMSLRIERVVPTVNVGSEASRKKMKGWIDKWLADRTKGGVLKVCIDEDGVDESRIQEWDGKGTKRDVRW